MAPAAPQPPRSVRSVRPVRSARPPATTLPRHAVGSLPTVDPAIWGPPLWRVLHTLAEHTTTQPQSQFWPALLNALKTDIPCPECRRHFTAWLRTHTYTLEPPRLRGARRYIMVDRKRVLAPPVAPLDPQTYTRQWVLDLHNDVNRRSRKVPWSVDQVRDANQSLDAARAALQTLATLIGPGAYAQLVAMMPAEPPVLVVAEEQTVTTEESPVLVVAEPPKEPEGQDQPLLVVAEEQTVTAPEDQVKPEETPYDPIAATTIVSI